MMVVKECCSVRDSEFVYEYALFFWIRLRNTGRNLCVLYQMIFAFTLANSVMVRIGA
jgi:hypothetical protein